MRSENTRWPTPRERTLAPRHTANPLPFNGFFGDDFLSLLFVSKETLPSHLATVKKWLLVVSDRTERKAHRAAVATRLGLWAQSNYTDHNRSGDLGASRPNQWFFLARQLNDVTGAFYYASEVMAQDDQTIDFDLQTSNLPRVTSKATPSRGLGESAARITIAHGQAWAAAVRTVMCHVQRRFRGWEKPEFTHALTCIVNYLALVPTYRGVSAKELDVEREIAERVDALKWLKPTWNRLIRFYAQCHHNSQETEANLFRQQHLVVSYLQARLQNLQSPTGTAQTPAPIRWGKDALVVIKGSIPDSSDRAERDYLKQYEALQSPLAFCEMPTLQKLHEIRDRLVGEFPWARVAIDQVTRELFARKQYGVRRLGITPTVLVGPPGTGKTRFAQRLAEELGAPNLVVNLAGMSDAKLLKGLTRGWAGNRPSRLVEFILQTRTPNPLIILDEIDKARAGSSNGGDPQEALLDLLEPSNARRYQDVYLMAECDLSHCLYICTSNSIERIPAPLLNRLQPVYFPPPGAEDTDLIVEGILRDLERHWNLPAGVLEVSRWEVDELRGLAPRPLRRAIVGLLGAQLNLTKKRHLH